MMPDLKRRITNSVLAVCSVGILLCTGVAPAHAGQQDIDVQEPEDLPKLEEQHWQRAIVTTDPQDAIIQYELDRFVQRLGDQESEEDDVIVLEADVLFQANSWELPENASQVIETLVEDVPQGAAVSIVGHTDSQTVLDMYDFDNQQLSENRAQAVPEALESQRADLDIISEGRGDTEPAVTEDPDDPGTYAANRRVEIRYES